MNHVLLNLMLAVISVSAFLACSSKSSSAKADKPNIIYIMADDLGYGDIGVYGQKIIQTPNIDQLAHEGMTFKNFYAGSTVCAPSRASLLTGQHTGTTKVRGNGEFPLDPEKKIIPELLSERGYTNAMFGKWGLGLKGTTGSPEIRGWDQFIGHLHHVDAHYQKPDSLDMISDGKIVRKKIKDGAYANDIFTEAAIDFINEQPKENPFFLYLSYTIPHAELVVPNRYLEKHLDQNGNSIHVPEKAWPPGRHYGEQEFPRAAYAALVESIDDYVGMIMETLKQAGIDENTLVIFTSDNGTHIEGGRTMEDVHYLQSSGEYRGVKRDLYTGGIKEPFIARWPAVVEPQTISSHTAAFWDIYPTFAEISGKSVQDEEIDGLSFLPELAGQKNQLKHEFLYWEFHEFGGKQAVLKGKWKAIRLNANSNPTAPVELYDLEEDQGEQNDLAEKYPGKAAEMTKLMDSIRTTNPNFNF